ncbi:Fe(3+) dicitrate transport protein [Methylohalomonas lacus]|uniref:Fe(3+) dicitrate transport protein n=1 Tax=Methylohalomonas lacus TaxID=398773 RepID=A0AAE3HLW6_9GAMM|nr:TonB-dependent receptor plug domain-containing protein [Methylohalomonas lacus]MCS3902863.1 Fe(3+) dicitrate transport protein [Methylohalomonas lacus]
MKYSIRRGLPGTTLGLAVAAVVSAPVYAQGTTDETIRNLPSIDVKEILPSEVRYSPGAANILTDEEIDTYRPYTLHDALDFIPGVRTLEDDIYGRRGGISVRGAPGRRSRKTLLMEDGTPINGSSYLDPSAHYTPPMERLERVDVLKGNGMILHGPLNNHGIINFRNKQPTLEPETTVEVGVGNQNANKRHFMHTRTEGDVGMVFAYTGFNGDGAFDISEFQYDDFFASADWDINSRHSLGGSFTYFRERSDYDESNLTPVEFDRAPRKKLGRFGQEFHEINVDYFKFDLTHDFQVTDNLSMSSKFFRTDLDRPRYTVDPESILVGALPDFVYEDPDDRFIAGEQGIMVSRDRHYRTYGVENRMELANVEAIGMDHTFQWGVRFERHFLDDKRHQGAQGQVIDRDNPGTQTRDDKYNASAFSVFFQDAMSFGDWTVTPGLRAEYYEQEKSSGGENQNEYRTLLLPGISALYDGFQDTQVFASVQRGYTPAAARTAGDFPLRPETGINSQVGLRTNAVKGVTAEAAIFYNDLRNTIVNTQITIDGQDLVINSGDSIAYGVDLGLRFDSAAYTGSAYNWFAQLAYNYTRAEFDGGRLDGNRVPEIPEHVGSLTVGVDHADGWHVSGTMSHFGSFFTDVANTKDQVLADEDGNPVGPADFLEIREPAVLGEVASRTLFSARASYTLQRSPNTELWIQGRNLTDKLYIADHANGLRPGFERTFIGGVTVNF